jgi:hypothetical protein
LLRHEEQSYLFSTNTKNTTQQDLFPAPVIMQAAILRWLLAAPKIVKKKKLRKGDKPKGKKRSIE